uniref:CCR4-Not complex component Not1 C-terminal domain-containing protein n=1 Tax=Chlamydomonas euryale TaxID=1486919 RepID=A0A7R9VR39_9CHLO
MSHVALDPLVRLISAAVVHGGGEPLLSRFLGVLVGVVKREADELGTAFNARPFLRLLAGLLSELARVELPKPVDSRCLHAVGVALHRLQPVSVPAFAFAWLELISHRSFVPRVLSAYGQGWVLYRTLLLSLFQFLEPYLRLADLPDSVRALYRGTLRLLLMLLHDFPEFLCEQHHCLCDAIPTSCVQMRNLVLSAFPRHMRLPDPFTPNLKVDMLPEIAVAPRLSPHPDAQVPEPLRAAIDAYLHTRSPASLPSDLAKQLAGPAPEGSPPGTSPSGYNAPAINALALYIGSAASASAAAATAAAANAC